MPAAQNSPNEESSAPPVPPTAPDAPAGEPAPVDPAAHAAPAPAVDEAPPVSAGPPTTEYPPVEPGAPAFGAPGPAPKKSKTVPILAVATGVLLVVAIVLTVVVGSTAGKLADNEDRLAASEQTVEDLTGANTSLKDEVDDLNEELGDTEDELTDATEANEALTACIGEVEKFFEAVAEQSSSALEKAIKGMDKACEEAENYR